MAGDCDGETGGEEDASGRKRLLRGEWALIGIEGRETEGFLKVGKIGKWIRVLKEAAIVVEFVDRVGAEAQAIVLEEGDVILFCRED